MVFDPVVGMTIEHEPAATEALQLFPASSERVIWPVGIPFPGAMDCTVKLKVVD